MRFCFNGFDLRHYHFLRGISYTQGDHSFLFAVIWQIYQQRVKNKIVRRQWVLNWMPIDFSWNWACSQIRPSIFSIFKVRRARVIKYKQQGIYWPPAQRGTCVFEKNEKKNWINVCVQASWNLTFRQKGKRKGAFIATWCDKSYRVNTVKTDIQMDYKWTKLNLI